jgi:hypothetical protein
VHVDLAVARPDGSRGVGERAGAVDHVDGRHVVGQEPRRPDDGDLVDGAVAIEDDLQLGHQVRVVHGVGHPLALEIDQEAEAPVLVNAPVHASDEGGEGGGPGVQLGLVPRPHLGQEVLQRRLNLGHAIGEAPLLLGLLLGGEGHRRLGVIAEQVLILLGAQAQAAPAALSGGPGHVFHALQVLLGHGPHPFRIAGQGGVHRLRTDLVLALGCLAHGQQRLAVVAVRGGQALLLVRGDLRGLPAELGLAILELGDLVLLVTDLLILTIGRRGGGLTLLFLLQVGAVGPGLLLHPVVLLRQVLGLGRRLLLLVDREVDALLLGSLLLRLGWRRGGGRRLLRLGRRWWLGLHRLLRPQGQRLLGGGRRRWHVLDGGQVRGQIRRVDLLEGQLDLLLALLLLAPAQQEGQGDQREQQPAVNEQRGEGAAPQKARQPFVSFAVHAASLPRTPLPRRRRWH